MRSKKHDVLAFLATCEADYRAVLYKARWDEAAAAVVVPPLIETLHIDDQETQQRALAAFATIGPIAWQAAPHIIPFLFSTEAMLYQTAAHALYCVSLKKPEPAIQPLIEMAAIEGREKFAMHALIELGPAAKAAIPFFIRAFDDSTVYMRRLALRGLKEIGAKGQELNEILQRAATDRSKEIREYAAKLAAHNRAQFVDSHLNSDSASPRQTGI
jgi:HEAT repeat protein